MTYAPPLLDARQRDAAATSRVVEWLRWLEIREKAPGTISAYSYRADRLLAAHPGKELEEFTEGDLNAVLVGVPKASRRQYLTAYVSLFRTWAYKRDLIPADPTKLLDELILPRKPKVIDVFSEAEVEALIGMGGGNTGEDGFRMNLMLDTGLRIAELCNLRVRDFQIDLPAMTLPPVKVSRETRRILKEAGFPEPSDRAVTIGARSQLVVLKGKGSKDRVVPLTARLAQRFADWQLFTAAKPDEYVFGHLWAGTRPGIKHRTVRLSPDAFRKSWWYPALDLAGVRRLSPHAARHTLATTLIRRGAPMAHVQKILGHASVQTTVDLYVHLVTSDLADAISLLEA